MNTTPEQPAAPQPPPRVIHMTAADLEAFQDHMNWTRARLGDELDISQDRLRRMFDGVVEIPRYIALACSALAMDIPPWKTYRR